jgi:hypothetical protein
VLAGILELDNQDGLDSNIECSFVAPLSIISNQPVSSSDTIRLRRILSDVRAQRWEIQTRLAPKSVLEGSHPFLARSVYNGYSNKLPVRPPQPERLPGIPPLVELATTYAIGPPTYLQGARQIYLDNSLTPEGTYLPGDFINIQDTGATYSKLHLVVSRSQFSLFIYPGLLRKMTSVLTIRAGRRARGYFYIDQDTKLGVTYIDGILADPGQITLVEAI